MHAEFSYAHLQWLFIVHTHHCTVKSRNLWNQVQEKKLHFLSIGLWPFNAWHWNTSTETVCTQWSALSPHWTKVPLVSKHPAQQNCCVGYKNNNKLQRVTIQNVRKKILHVLHFKWTILIKYFSSYIKKCQTGTYFYGWVYDMNVQTYK